MSVLTFAVNDRFVIRTIKSHTSNPDREWSNTYEFLANDTGGIGDLTTLATTLVAYEVLIHSDFTHFVRTTVSTWKEDSVPYDPDTFLVFEEDTDGTRITSGEKEPLNVCWSVVRRPTAGRLGHIFYRGVLAQDDTAAPGGILQLSNPSGMSTTLESAISGSGLDAYIGQDATGPLVMAMVNKTGTNTRLVVELVSSGVSILPVDHAWFNRTTSP